MEILVSIFHIGNLYMSSCIFYFMTNLKVIDSFDSGLREFYLSHGALAQQPSQFGDDRSLFVHDLIDGKFKDYRGSFVAYQKGVFCGQSGDGQHLYNCLGRYYGVSSLVVFRVPARSEKIEDLSCMFGK